MVVLHKAQTPYRGVPVVLVCGWAVLFNNPVGTRSIRGRGLSTLPAIAPAEEVPASRPKFYRRIVPLGGK